MDEQKKTSGSLALNGAPQVITIPPSDPVSGSETPCGSLMPG
ncbi:MAG: hypothetical protein ACLRWQ_07995 [Flavonifractor plautii]